MRTAQPRTAVIGKQVERWQQGIAHTFVADLIRVELDAGLHQIGPMTQSVGDQILPPGWDDFRTHVPYQAYDVTKQVKTGQNAIAAWLAPGWYTTPLMWFRQGYNYGDTPPALKAQLRLEHADGSIEWIATDASWKADISPISQAEIYDGESYDARKQQPGWDTAAFSDAHWKQVDLVKPVMACLVAV